MYLPTPQFPVPGIVSGKPVGPGIETELKFLYIAGPSFEETARRYDDVDFVGARITFSPDEFARSLAKMASWRAGRHRRA